MRGVGELARGETGMDMTRCPWCVCALLAAGLVGFAAIGRCGPGKPAAEETESPRYLQVTLMGDSVEFVLVDPVGRVAVLGIDSSSCGIPDCRVEKYSDLAMDDHDDSDSTALDREPSDYPVYGGGLITLENPEPGTWRLEGRAVGVCPDTCEAKVYLRDLDDQTTDTMDAAGASIPTGESVTWRLTVTRRSNRGGAPWAYLRPEPALQARRRLSK